MFLFLPALTVLNEGEDRVPHKVGRDLAEVDQQPPKDDEGHQNLPRAQTQTRARSPNDVGEVSDSGM